MTQHIIQAADKQSATCTVNRERVTDTTHRFKIREALGDQRAKGRRLAVLVDALHAVCRQHETHSQPVSSLSGNTSEIAKVWQQEVAGGKMCTLRGRS